MSTDTTDRAVHLAHCNQGEWIGTCKYGEDLECPALGTDAVAADALTVSRNLANRAAASLLEHGDFCGALLLDNGWELCSPAYVADIGRALDEGRRAKDALHGIIVEAHKGLGI